MPAIELIDATFVVAPRQELARWLHDESAWATWWPELTLRVFMDRGDAGIRWSVTGDSTGSLEVWLEPVLDGTVVHLFVRLDPASGTLSTVAAARERGRYAKRWKAMMFEAKDRFEAGREVGVPPSGSAGSGSRDLRRAPTKRL